MNIDDYFRWYREGSNDIDYNSKTVSETIQRNKEIYEIKKHLESIRLKNQEKKNKTKLEKIRDEFFYKIQSLIGGDTKYLVVSPPNDGNKQYYIDYINKYNDWFELTITFIPLYRQVFTDYQIKNLLYRELSCYIKDVEIILIPEYNKSNHLHFHGYIRGKPSKINKVKQLLSQLFGRTELKPIKYFNSYIDYVFKDYSKEVINYKKYIICLINQI